jgi:hypothetical protein
MHIKVSHDMRMKHSILKQLQRILRVGGPAWKYVYWILHRALSRIYSVLNYCEIFVGIIHCPAHCRRLLQLSPLPRAVLHELADSLLRPGAGIQLHH